MSQTALRFLLQKGVILIPKSTHKERMEQNFNIFDFELTAEDIAKIEALDTGKSIIIDHQTDEAAEQFVSLATPRLGQAVSYDDISSFNEHWWEEHE